MTESSVPGAQDLAPQTERAAPLGSSAGRAATLLMAATLATRLLNFIGQIVLGAILLHEDFGLFAIANSVAGFIMVLRDGGMQTLIVQRGDRAYDELEGPGFWLGFAFNVAAGALLFALAPWIAALYAEPKLTRMLWVIASSIPLYSLEFVPMARLRMDMRFGALSVIEIMSGIVRYGGMIVGAVAGLGPMAFVAPLPAIAVLEGVAACLFARRTPWRRPPGVDRWRSFLGASSWLMVSSLAGNALYLGSQMALGLTAPVALVGLFFFGYSFMYQSGYLIISTAERVLLTVFSRLRAEPERQRSAVLRTLRAVSVLGFSACALLGAWFAPLESLIWKGKWAAVVGVAQVMAICYPLFTLHIIARSVITGWGRFRAHAISIAVSGIVIMLVSVVAGAVTRSPTVVAWIIGLAMALVSFVYLAWGVADLQIRPAELVREILPILACGAVGLFVGILADRLALAAVLARGLDPLDVSLRIRMIANGVRILAVGVSCVLVTVLTLRLLAPRGLLDCVEVLPGQLSGPTRRFLGLQSR